MAIKFLCPLGHRLKVHNDLAGKAGHCPICRQRVFIPLVSAAPPRRKRPAAAGPHGPSRRDARASPAARLSEVRARPAAPTPPVERLQPQPIVPPTDWLDDVPAAPPPTAPPAVVTPVVEADLPPRESAEPASDWDALSLELGLPPRLRKPTAESRRESSAARPPAPRPIETPRRIETPPVPATSPRQLDVKEPFEDLAPLVAALRPELALAPTVRQPQAAPRGRPIAQRSPAVAVEPPSLPLLTATTASVSALPPYVPDKAKVHTVYLLAAGMAAVSVFCAVPGLQHLNLAEAPDWARFVLLLSALQLVYCAWMASLPDWSTVWVGMVVFAVVSAIYGMGLAIATATPVERPVVLELTDVRGTARGWCAAAMLLTGLMTYCCGRVSGGWRRSLASPRVREPVRSGLAVSV